MSKQFIITLLIIVSVGMNIWLGLISGDLQRRNLTMAHELSERQGYDDTWEMCFWNERIKVNRAWHINHMTSKSTWADWDKQKDVSKCLDRKPELIR